VLGGKGHPLIQQILKDLYDKGKGNGDRKHQRHLLQHRAGHVFGAFEGARLAIKNEGWPLTPPR
jgi:branched-chain amino acid transport system substrate-binding protein